MIKLWGNVRKCPHFEDMLSLRWLKTYYGPRNAAKRAHTHTLGCKSAKWKTAPRCSDRKGKLRTECVRGQRLRCMCSTLCKCRVAKLFAALTVVDASLVICNKILRVAVNNSLISQITDTFAGLAAAAEDDSSSGGGSNSVWTVQPYQNYRLSITFH